jgi:hypothetical protein
MLVIPSDDGIGGIFAAVAQNRTGILNVMMVYNRGGEYNAYI